MTTTPTTLLRTSGAVLLSLALLGAGTTAASASGGSGGGRGEVRASGHCSGSSVWKLKAKHDDGRLETELEVDTRHVGRTWSVRLSDNGTRVYAGRRTTTAPSGSFTVERRLVDRAGRDRITAVARDLRTGERCVGALTVAG